MRVGALRIELFISNSSSLKHKRSVIKALKDRIADNFNVSIAEVDAQDKWQKAVLGVASVSADKQVINSALDKILDIIRQNHEVQILDYEMEII